MLLTLASFFGTAKIRKFKMLCWPSLMLHIPTQLRDVLSRLSKDSRLDPDYLHKVLSLCVELATASAPISNSELIVKILSGLGYEL